MANNNKSEQNDYIASFLVNIIEFCKARKQAVLTALVILVVAAAVGVAYSSHQKKADQESWGLYYAAQVNLLTQGEAEGFGMLDVLNEKFPGTNAALYGQLLKGDLLFAQDNFAQAADVYKPLTNAKNPYVMTVACLSLADAQQAMKDYAASAETAETFIQNNSKSFALPQAYFTLALSQELAGKKDAAAETYKHILESYTKTYYGAFAKDKLNELRK